MFVLCKFPDESVDRFIVYDEKEFNPDEFGLVKDDEIHSIEDMEKHAFWPILSLNDFLLRALNQKARTITHILGEIGINSWYDLQLANNLIELKKSKLSARQRYTVKSRFKQIKSLLEDGETEQISNNNIQTEPFSTDENPGE